MNLLLLASALAGVFYIALGLLVHIRGMGIRPNNIFWGLCICMSGMTFANAFMYGADTVPTARMWHLVGVFFWAAIFPLTNWLVFELSTGRVFRAARALLLTAAIAAGFVLLAAWPTIGGTVAFVRTDFGWARDFSALGHWEHVPKTYVAVGFLSAFVMLGRWFWKTRSAGERNQALWLLVTGILTVAVGVVNNTLISPTDRAPSVPMFPHFVGLIWAFGFLMGLWKYNLMPGLPSFAMAEVLAAIQDAIVFLDADGVVIELNQRVKTIFGIEPGTVRGRHIGELAAFRKVLPVVFDPSPTIDDEITVTAGDGTQIPVNAISTRIYNNYGHFKGTVVVLQDLRPMRQLLDARRMESLGVMAAGIAHDFNNLLTVAGGYLELTMKGLDRERSDRSRAHLIEASFALAQARSLTGQLMTFSRGGQPVRRNVSVSRLIDESAGLVLAGTSVALVRESEENLWPVHVDPVQTGQVFNNLLLNAVQSMEGGGRIIIRTSNLPGDGTRQDMVRIEIEDTGCGIPEDIRGRIFEPFFSARKGGTGLGLASVNSIVTRHGGNISVESAVGQGSLFTVDLPRGRTPEPETAVAGHGASVSNGRVLVMDDIESVRKVAVEMLQAIGYQADSVEDGASAVAAVKEHCDQGNPYDVVILDLTVPGGTGGIAAISEIKRIQPAVGTVVSSGYSAGSELADYSNCGFDAALPKPYTLGDLSAAVGKAAEMKKARSTGRNRTISQWVKRERLEKALEAAAQCPVVQDDPEKGDPKAP